MAKLDEITELLTEELEGFKKSITRLETLCKELKSSEVVLEIHAIKQEMSELREKQDDHFQRQSRNLTQFSSKMATAKLVPKWLLALCCIASAVTVLTMGYFGYHFIKLEDFKTEAFNNGKEQVILDLRGYFNENPNVYKEFKAWLKEKDRVPNQK
jgi:hypothetical protein